MSLVDELPSLAIAAIERIWLHCGIPVVSAGITEELAIERGECPFPEARRESGNYILVDGHECGWFDESSRKRYLHTQANGN